MRHGFRLALPGIPLLLVTAVIHSQDRAPATAIGDLLGRAAGHVRAVEEALSSVVAEERYEQRRRSVRVVGEGVPPAAVGGVPVTTPQTRSVSEKRTLVSDFLMIKVPGLDGWVPFRDVLEVDGSPVSDRRSRLTRLFTQSPATAMEQARLVMEESARYNLGTVARTINVPTLPLSFLLPDRHARFAWTLGGRETVRGVPTRKLAFRETGRPTVVRSPDGDLPLEGTFWIDPVDGAVARVELRTKAGGLDVRVTVAYARYATVNAWVPIEMTERYRSRDEQIDAVATYWNFRRMSEGPGIGDCRLPISEHALRRCRAPRLGVGHLLVVAAGRAALGQSALDRYEAALAAYRDGQYGEAVAAAAAFSQRDL